MADAHRYLFGGSEQFLPTNPFGMRQQVLMLDYCWLLLRPPVFQDHLLIRVQAKAAGKKAASSSLRTYTASKQKKRMYMEMEKGRNNLHSLQSCFLFFKDKREREQPCEMRRKRSVVNLYITISVLQCIIGSTTFVTCHCTISKTNLNFQIKTVVSTDRLSAIQCVTINKTGTIGPKTRSKAGQRQLKNFCTQCGAQEFFGGRTWGLCSEISLPLLDLQVPNLIAFSSISE